MHRRIGSAFAGGVALAVCMLLASAAYAERPDYGRFGAYLGAGFSYSTDLYEDEIDDALGTGFSVDVDESVGANARLGLRLLSFAAIELQYEWLDTYDINIPNAGGQSSVDVQTLTANLKLFLPIRRFHPYLLAGIGYQNYELEHDYFNSSVVSQDEEIDLAGRLGLGFDVYLTESVVVFLEGSAVLSNAEVRLPSAVTSSTIDNLFYAGVQTGLLYRF